MFQKQGTWGFHDLEPTDTERRLLACDPLLQRPKGEVFLHGTDTGDEK